MKTLLQGITQLLADPLGVLCLLTLCSVTFLCFTHRVGDVAFASVASMLTGSLAVIKHKSFSGSDIDNPAKPFPGE